MLMNCFKLLLVITILSSADKNKRRTHHRYDARRTTSKHFTKSMCMDVRNTLTAKHKVCFLRPDSGPCRADIIQWYYDAKQKKCYRFFWGGCQGNGNKFETKLECNNYCYLNTSYSPPREKPHFCSLAFDYGTCFGHYNRWGWDMFGKTCKPRLYSGCGGNQNNFETQAECMATCLHGPDNVLTNLNRPKPTTCIPLDSKMLQ